MRILDTIPLTSRLKAVLTVSNDEDVYFQLKMNKKLLAIIPAFTFDEVLQIYQDLIKRDPGIGLQKLLKEIYGYKYRLSQKADVKRQKDISKE